ncbi:hypothetical protein [Halorussus litoreus]|uniref:hypothetical protein n=1 Tax=Halorussus litoreus TaxID=1710536 RepID=UPI000E26EC91|nr:hypothetical protein [Halorussus litoreus]
MREILGPNYRNLSALAVVIGLLGFAYVVAPHPLVQYGVWLVVFSVWMVWFVAAAREWISKADF